MRIRFLYFIFSIFLAIIFGVKLLAGFYITLCSSPSPRIKATPLQDYVPWVLSWGKGVQGSDILCCNLSGGLRKWLSKTKHNLSWGWPIQERWFQAIQEVIILLQLRLLRLLHWRTYCIDCSCLGPNTLWNGCWLWSVCSCHGNGINLLDSRYTSLQEQAPSRKYFHSNCSGKLSLASLLLSLSLHSFITNAFFLFSTSCSSICCYIF